MEIDIDIYIMSDLNWYYDKIIFTIWYGKEILIVFT